MPTSNQQPATMSKKELAAAYNICPATFSTWLKRAGIAIDKNVKILTPAQVQTIFDKIGEP